MFKVVRKLHRVLPIFALASFATLPLLANGSASASENVTTNVTIEPSLTVTIPSTPITLNLNPASTTSGNNNITITVGTNNATGYKTVMTSRSGGTDLVDATDTSLVIPTLDTGTSYASLSAFPANHWGYKQDSGNYKPFETDTTILESTTFANVDTTTLNFATKIDYLQEAGAYSTTLVFDTVVNPWAAEMQNLDPTLCTATPLEVLDTRDDQVYTVQRLADGNCWMMDNLNLGDIDNYPLRVTQLDSTNSNVSTPVTVTTFNSWKKTSASGSDRTTPEYISVPGIDSTSETPYGTLYSFCAITAGTYCAASGSGNAQYDICPAGWRMPTGGSGGEYQNLYNQPEYNSSAKMRAPIRSGGAAFTLAGWFTSGAPIDQGVYASFYSSTYYNAQRMYALYFETSSVDPVSYSYGNREIGRSLRCIMKDARTISDVDTMQNISPQVVANTASGATATLRDARDGQEYTVAKINGKLWMTRNLAIGCNGTGSTYGSTMVSKALTPTNTNIASNFSTPTASLTLGDSGTDARMECSSTYGAWYNFVTATGGTITDSTITQDAVYDICPFGWKMPTYSDASGIGSYTSQFQVVNGSNYAGGSIDPRTRGIWWFATKYNNTKRRYMYSENGAALRIDGSDADLGFGFYLRCIAK